MLFADGDAAGGMMCLLFFFGILGTVAYTAKMAIDKAAEATKSVLTPVFVVVDDTIKHAPQAINAAKDIVTRAIEENKEEIGKDAGEFIANAAKNYLLGGSPDQELP